MYGTVQNSMLIYRSINILCDNLVLGLSWLRLTSTCAATSVWRHQLCDHSLWTHLLLPLPEEVRLEVLLFTWRPCCRSRAETFCHFLIRSGTKINVADPDPKLFARSGFYLDPKLIAGSGFDPEPK